MEERLLQMQVFFLLEDIMVEHLVIYLVIQS